MTQPRVRLSQMQRAFISDLRARIENSHVLTAYQAASILKAIDAAFNPKPSVTKIEKDQNNV